MNIFYIDPDPIKAAEMHCDQHCVKMILETGQMLSTAHRVLDGRKTKRPSVSGRTRVDYWVHPDAYKEKVLYKCAHVKHPSNIWIRESVYNYAWSRDLFNALCREFVYRYGKVHQTQTRLGTIIQEPPKNISLRNYSAPPQCMPEEFKSDDTVEAYRKFYIEDKSSFARWNKVRPAPEWYVSC